MSGAVLCALEEERAKSELFVVYVLWCLCDVIDEGRMCVGQWERVVEYLVTL